MAVDTTTPIERIAPMDDGDPLWSIERVAKYMEVSVHQVRRFYQDGELKIVALGPKLIRFRKSDVEAFIISHYGDWNEISSAVS